ncbi:hypothetical protein [Pseudomonas lundensis]|uniref:hypothetical protein n=1 Tax=Pseudomonas lundensis TaxID=86185 RepID=UPI001890BF71|nr:hypothetical protein [Pseudomonas lundensis]QOF92742.1 hypothetical protein IF654_06200 [Pseudomonas lundensis]
MNIDDSPDTPIFLDDNHDNHDILAELPLMVTRYTLRSVGLSLEMLEQVDTAPNLKSKATVRAKTEAC